jgi:hypothetical protein
MDIGNKTLGRRTWPFAREIERLRSRGGVEPLAPRLPTRGVERRDVVKKERKETGDEGLKEANRRDEREQGVEWVGGVSERAVGWVSERWVGGGERRLHTDHRLT